MAHADLAQDLTVHLSMNCPFDLNICSVNPYDQYPGNPASGHVNFIAINLPWSYDFVTGYPVSWMCDRFCDNYNATFGEGGTFNMGGPMSLTFIGEVTSGRAWQNSNEDWGVDLSFSGKWSNGMSAHGEILDLFTGMNGPYASLDVYTVPEPATLALLGTGALVLAWRAQRGG
jgi:hypothetical protein